MYLKSTCVFCTCGYFSVRNWRTITCICWRHIVKKLVYILRYIYNFGINVFIKIAGVCGDFCRVVHKTKLFVIIMYVYLDGLETLSSLLVLLTLCMSYRTRFDDEYPSIQIYAPSPFFPLPGCTKFYHVSAGICFCC